MKVKDISHKAIKYIKYEYGLNSKLLMRNYTVFVLLSILIVALQDKHYSGNRN